MKYFSWLLLTTLFLICPNNSYAEGNKERKTVLTGFVLNQDMEPVAGASVQVGNYTFEGFVMEFSGTTDEYGYYLIPVDESSTPRMAMVSAEGYPKVLFGENKFDFSNGSQTHTFYLCNAAVFHAKQLATIFLPTVPDASLGQYYRLDRVEDKHLIFEREMNPKADVPYLIIPDKDFRIEYGDMDVRNGFVEQSFPEASFHGFYSSYPYDRFEKEGSYLIDKSPDCSYRFGGSHGTLEYGARVGARRALLTLKSAGTWNYFDWKSHTVNDDWMKVLVFHDNTTGKTFTYDRVYTSVTPKITSFAGLIVNQEKAPVAGVRVKLESKDGMTVYETTTDSYGSFLLPIADANQLFEVAIAAEGYPEQKQYQDGWQPFDSSNGSLLRSFTITNSAIFTVGKPSTIILPVTPDASLGKYYYLDGVEDGKIIWQREYTPQAHVPYLIIPEKNFEIGYKDVTLSDKWAETTVKGASLKGYYYRCAFQRTKDEFSVLIGNIEDCEYIFSDIHQPEEIGCVIPPMRAVLVLNDAEYNWADYNVVLRHAASYFYFPDRLFVFHDEPAGIVNVSASPSISSIIYDLSGRRLSSISRKGVYVRNSKKYVMK